MEWFLIVWLLEAMAGEVVALVNCGRLDGRLPPTFGGSRLSIIRVSHCGERVGVVFIILVFGDFRYVLWCI